MAHGDISESINSRSKCRGVCYVDKTNQHEDVSSQKWAPFYSSLTRVCSLRVFRWGVMFPWRRASGANTEDMLYNAEIFKPLLWSSLRIKLQRTASCSPKWQRNTLLLALVLHNSADFCRISPGLEMPVCGAICRAHSTEKWHLKNLSVTFLSRDNFAVALSNLQSTMSTGFNILWWRKRRQGKSQSKLFESHHLRLIFGKRKFSIVLTFSCKS